MGELDFKEARYNAVLKVMEGDRKRYAELEKKYKLLQSEFNTLKIVHMNVINDCIDKKHELREQVKKLKGDYNDLLDRERNKGWNEL